MQVVRRLKEASANATVAQLRRWSQAVDENGNTALILGAKRLMNCGLFKRAYQFAVMMLKFGSDVNWLNNGGRSLITYTVHYMDQAIDITRLLLNCGATVWLEGETIYNRKVFPPNGQTHLSITAICRVLNRRGFQVLYFLVKNYSLSTHGSVFEVKSA